MKIGISKIHKSKTSIDSSHLNYHIFLGTRHLTHCILQFSKNCLPSDLKDSGRGQKKGAGRVEGEISGQVEAVAISTLGVLRGYTRIQESV